MGLGLWLRLTGSASLFLLEQLPGQGCEGQLAGVAASKFAAPFREQQSTDGGGDTGQGHGSISFSDAA
jgi:hypothetical protein